MNATSQQYSSLEEFTVLNQIDMWRGHRDHGLSDLAARFLNRVPFAMVECPNCRIVSDADLSGFDDALRKLVEANAAYRPTQLYCLKDTVKPKYNQPYFPEKEEEEQTVKNSIRVRSPSGAPVEISSLVTQNATADGSTNRQSALLHSEGTSRTLRVNSYEMSGRLEEVSPPSNERHVCKR